MENRKNRTATRNSTTRADEASSPAGAPTDPNYTSELNSTAAFSRGFTNSLRRNTKQAGLKEAKSKDNSSFVPLNLTKIVYPGESKSGHFFGRSTLQKRGSTVVNGSIPIDHGPFSANILNTPQRVQRVSQPIIGKKKYHL